MFLINHSCARMTQPKKGFEKNDEKNLIQFKNIGSALKFYNTIIQKVKHDQFSLLNLTNSSKNE